MTVNSASFVADTLYFIKNDIASNVTDPISSTRTKNSKWVMTSYPSRAVEYPLITLKIINYNATRAGMQTTAMDLTMNVEIRVWGRNTKERDQLFQTAFLRLKNIQFTASTGSAVNNLHNFRLNSAVEIDEEKVKSKVIEVTYQFYNL